MPGQKEDAGKRPDSLREPASFINNTGSARSSGQGSGTNPGLLEMPSIVLPKGGGAMKGIDEKFTVNASNGTASCSIPLPFSQGRKGTTPELSLSYNSGGGNSVFGLGWNIAVPSIQRRTEKELPRYRDGEESDIFIFSGAEDLVPELVQDAQGKWIRKTSTEGTAAISYYRPRIESGFARIEQLNDGGNVYWRVRTKENVVSVFGQSDTAKLFSPVAGEGKDRIFRWCLEYSYDDKGNFIQYTYKKEDKDNVMASLSEKNHLNDLAPFTNIYCKRIQYGNATAWYEDGTPAGPGTPVPPADGGGQPSLPADFLFELVFDYGEHDPDKPTTQEVTTWPVRQDPFSDFRSGFEVRTYRLCRRVLMFHHFKAELGWDDYLVRSMELSYDQHPHLTYLSSVAQTGYIWNTDGSLRSKQSLPPQEFSYFQPGFSQDIKEITTDNIVNAPAGLDDSDYQWMDLYSEGISGILSEQAGGWFYKENLGNGAFSPARIVSPRPSVTGLRGGGLAIQDLEADGRKYLVSTQAGLRGYYALSPECGPDGSAYSGSSVGTVPGSADAGSSVATGSGSADAGSDREGGWQGFRAFDRYPNIDLGDPNLKFLDLNGDGMPDMLISQEQEFVWYAARGKMGYDAYHFAARAADEERGPQILFADKDEKMLIATADMSGDGLSDIVLITCAEVCYYPNLGYGRFGARVTLTMEGCFDNYDSFNPKFLHLADIDGSGTTDIVYIGNNKIQVWYNQSGNSLSDPSEFFNPFPELDNQSRISLIDLLGTGVSCLVWSSSLPSQSRAPLRYIDLMGGRKPHILYSYKNNIGKEVTLEYKSSTQYYLADKLQGHPWVTKLAFPVQCVSKVTVVDKVAQTRFTNEYSYHHGYYDAKEREFRGFARVEQRDCEEYDQFVTATQAGGAVNATEKDLYQPVVITKTWYHTGAWLHRKQLFHQLQNEYYPRALISSGQIDATDLITGLSDYYLDELSVLPEGLESSAFSECYRALKGLPLRQEVYSEEGDATTQLFPYTVTQHDYEVRLLQPQAGQPYAVFFSHEKETLTFNFERNPLDPRIAHTFNVEIDDYGNVLQSASIVYGRTKADATLPTDADRQQQTKPYIVYTQNLFTPAIDTTSVYRLPVSCETQTWELNAPAPAKTFYRSDEIGGLFAAAAIVLYEQSTLVNQKRKIKHSKLLFLKNDLTGPMAFGSQDTLGLPYETYSLAFTPTLAANIYGGKFDDGLWRNKGGYIAFQGDGNYWIRSGKKYFHPDLTADPDAQTIPAPTAADLVFARNNFYQPVAFEDNSGYLTKVFYDPYKLFMQRTVDAADNETNVDAFHYRTLAPWLLRDANDNRTGVRFDELSRVVRTFVMGKEGQLKGDPIDTGSTEIAAGDQPTTILEYAFRYYGTTGLLPDRVKTSVREQHYYIEPLPAQSSGGITGWLGKLFGTGGNAVTEPAGNVIWQDNYSYSDGSGQVVLIKAQAEPGMAPQRDAGGNLVFDGSGKLQQADTTPALRWVGNGRTIFNNKGKPVKQYEPYFDSSPEYNTENELAALGFTAILYYDALGRMIRTERPNGSFSKVEFDAWMQKTYDENDTVMDSSWYADRIGGALGDAEQEAAQKAAIHYNTPSVSYSDSLGHDFLTVADNKTQRSNETVLEEFYYTRKVLDVEGNILSLSDARGNTVMTWKYDMAGNICYQHSMDAGDRWKLADTMSKPLRLWDSRQQVFSYEYDSLHRPLNLKVNTGAGDMIYEQFQYGEGVTDDKKDNLRGKLYKQYDTAGQVTNEAYDFKGNPLGSTRTLLKDYTKIPDWGAAPVLETEHFDEETAFDALNRPIQQIAADGSIFQIGYNAANLLNSVAVRIRGTATSTSFVTQINYNAKRQREQILYGNATTTRYLYDLVTYRLTRLLTTATGGSVILQDLNYTYDPVGNSTRIFDNAQKTIFYGGQQVEAQSDYIYDAVYRLIEAVGREHTGQIGINATDNYNDSWCRLNLQPNSPVQLRNYTQKYFYDGVGNILKMQHVAAGPASWTRTYQYNAANNQLTKTTAAGQNYSYTYNEHGSMLTMPQLSVIDWNFREELQHANLGGGGDAYYVYNSSGQRIRKVIVKAGNKTTDRLYLGTVEIYRERTGSTITLERQTLHIMDDRDRVAMVDSRTRGNDGSPAQLLRYQYSNHLDSACLELDDAAKIISYEEYHPYGTTAYQATDASRQIPAKRYRYTGMERDEETGLNYHTARYYIPWLGRWSATDPIGIGDGLNIYQYASNNPIRLKDQNGMDNTDSEQRLTTDIRKITSATTAKGNGAGVGALKNTHVATAPTVQATPTPPPPPPSPPRPDPSVQPPEPPPAFPPPIVSPFPRMVLPPISMVAAPSPIFASWTNAASILGPGIFNFEYNSQVGGGSAGLGLTSQLSARLGLASYFELGVVGNLALTDPTTGSGGLTFHVGPTDLAADHYSSGFIGQVTAGAGTDPSGHSAPAFAASASYLRSRGGDSASAETDFNAGLNYQLFSNFGPGSASVPHVLAAQFLASNTWYLDPSHAQSVYLEGLVAPTVALGTFNGPAGGPPPLWGARVGGGAGFSTSATNSILTFSVNPFVDLTSRGVGGGALGTITIGGRAVVWDTPGGNN